MALRIITADERLSASENKTSLAVFGPPGVGKTTLIRTLPADKAVCLDLEAGMKSVQDWRGPSIPIRSFSDFRDLVVLIGGADPSQPADGFYSAGHFAHVQKAFAESGIEAFLKSRTIIFVDSITDLTRQAMAWAKQQPEAFSDRTGKPDVRGAYGLLGREVIQALKHLQHARGKTVVFVGVLEKVTDEFGASAWVPQMEGSKAGRARICRSGAKADHMLILEGHQGARKSTALKILAGENWFTDELPDLGSKDAAIHMQGVWIVEIAELDAIGRAEVSRIKAFLTRTTDRFRPPYGRHTVEIRRQCVFAGTVNPDTYLRDETGNRRFWPIRCGDIDIESLRRDRDQLWAEAVARFKDGAIWWLEDTALLKAAREEQDKRYQSDAWDGLIDRWLTHEIRVFGDSFSSFDPIRRESVLRHEPLTDVSVGEILEEAIGIEPARWNRVDQMRVSGYLKKNGWERYRTYDVVDGKTAREWRYRR